MEKIIAPIKPGTRSPTVANLQAALLLLAKHSGYLDFPEFEKDKLLQGVRDEEARQVYGVNTARVVALFRLQNSLKEHEGVDESTAERLNEFLDKLGAFSQSNTLRRIFGMVRDEYGKPLDNVTVEATDRDIRREEPLGSDKTRKGRYEIHYDQSKFRRAEKARADLVIRVRNADKTELHKTPIHFNVPDDVEINIVLNGATYKGPSEFEVLNETLKPLLDHLSPLDVREDDECQDVSFLSRESGHSEPAITAWVIAHRLAEATKRHKTKLDAAVLFGFTRQGQPVFSYDSPLREAKEPDRITLLEEKLLRDLAFTKTELQQSLLESALADGLIPAHFRAHQKNTLETLRRLRLHFAADTTYGVGKGTIRELLNLNPAAKRKEAQFMTAFVAHDGPMNEFWKKLEQDKLFTPKVLADVKLSFELGALTKNHIPLVAELNAMFGRGEIKSERELAAYSREDWKKIFRRKRADGKPVGVPSNIDGANDNDRREHYAAILEKRYERAYPTTSFTAKLKRAAKSPVEVKANVVSFLEDNPDFNLSRHRLDHYLAENKGALRGIADNVADKAVLVKSLKSVQRVFKLNPTYAAVNALLSRKLDSAQQIYFMGVGQFMTAMVGSGVNKIEAKKIYQKAENVYALAVTMFGNFNQAVNALVPFAALSPAPSGTLQKKIADVPNLHTLFGTLNYCECTHCRSVYSSAAYFVDVLHFLGERTTQGSANNKDKNVKQVLLERRPDLGELELSCENTNTPLPYIDLVNEVLEDVVAPPPPVTLNNLMEGDLAEGPVKQSVRNELASKNFPITADALVYAPDLLGQWVVRDKQHAYKIFKTGGTLKILPTKQTFLSASELRANPQYTNTAAYDKLTSEVFPLTLPFDLWHYQACTYLNHLGVQQPRLLELFQQTLADGSLSPSNLDIDCTWLGMTETERKVVTGTLVGKSSWDYWGLSETNNSTPDPEKPADPTANVSGTWIKVLSNVNVMLNRSGLTYKELLQLLAMTYVNPAKDITVVDTADPNAANCDTALFTIQNLSQAALDRMHRFIRLWRKLGCAMWELDILLPDVNPAPGVVAKQITDAALTALSKMKRLKDELGLDWRVIHSLYHNLDHSAYLDFNQSETPAIQTLYQHLFRNKLVDAVANFPESPDQLSGTIEEKIPGLLAAFRLKEADLILILEDLSLNLTDALDWAVVSHIHRIVVLAKALGLSVDDFLRLKRLWAKDPFATPADTLDFVVLAEKISDSGFLVLELDYVLAHQSRPGVRVDLDDKEIITAVQALRDGLQKISDDLRLKTEETFEDYVKSKVGLLPTLLKDADQLAAISIIDGTWKGPAADRNALIDAYFVNVLDLTEAKTKLAQLNAGLSPNNRKRKVDERFEYVQQALERFLLRVHQENFVQQKMSEEFQLEGPIIQVLAKHLTLPGTTTTLLPTINDPKLLKKLPDGSYDFVLAEANFPDLFKTMRLLHKVALLLGKLKPKVEELKWWLEGNHARDLDWLNLSTLPLDTTSTVALSQWENVYDFFRWKNDLPKVELTAFEFLENVLNGIIPQNDTIDALAKLTTWEKTDIKELITAFKWDAKKEFANAKSLKRLSDCMQALRRLGVNAARALQWAKPLPTSAEAESLKQTVKAKYDLAQWQHVIQPIQDEFRERKRAALVAWLVTHPDQARGQSWSDANGLFSYFLIDVEMSSCMLTSRLKQAAASAQLFVQRCLMNLEHDIFAKTDLDPKWRQWQWMRYYRVWEANRKVFLYPENWLEPELRDEKSPFFKELENELMQNDPNRDTAEQAYLNYLEKLDKVANLEIRTIHNEVLGDETVLHVFGRTRSSQAPDYYYRRRINGARWTPWEKVELEISGNHLIAGVHNRRLYLFWPQFLTKAASPTQLTTPQPGQATDIPQPNSYWEVRLFWSELKKGKWTPKILSDSFQEIYQSNTNGDHPENISFRLRNDLQTPGVVAGLYLTPEAGKAPGSLVTERHQAFTTLFKGYTKVGHQINRVFEQLYNDEYDFEYLIAPSRGHYQNGLITNGFGTLYFLQNTIASRSFSLGVPANDEAVSVELLQSPMFSPTYIVIDAQAAKISSKATFSVWDARHTYMVDMEPNEFTYETVSGRPMERPRFEFYIHYHPFIELFIKELNRHGIKGLLNRQIQVNPSSLPDSPPPFDFALYSPGGTVVQNYYFPDKSRSYPFEDVDFSYLGAYAPYNWELFFHVPFLIANKLSANQRFEEALEWFHYIFDPTSTDNATADPDTPQQRYWITKPFFETTKADYYEQKIENLLLSVAEGEAELRVQVEEWRNHPFNPHLIARMRTVAYQKNVLIKYVQTLIAWGDQLFRRDTIETNNEATQLYILAASILGPRPKSIPKRVPNPVKTFYQLEKEGIDDFGNVLKEVENLLPTVSSSAPASEDGPELPRLDVLYFCIPNNEKLLALWDTVADRLFKLRHCMNIEGVVRQLPLFEPPIDPALLVRAAAAGLDIGSVVNDLNAPMPLYRFTFMIQHALELCNEVKSLGSALLAALEKKDAEGVSLLRSSHELLLLAEVKKVKEKQIEEALRTWEGVNVSKNLTEERKAYYEELLKNGMSSLEYTSLFLSGGAVTAEIAATTLNVIASASSNLPQVSAGVSGYGGSPNVTFSMGGQSAANGLSIAADISRGVASIAQTIAGMTATMGSYERRANEWDFQKRLAEKELPQIEKQIAAADIRYRIAQQELVNHDKQKENSQKEAEYLHSKFTNEELYGWMTNQLSTLYFQSYQLAYDIAKRAERCFRYELGLSDSSYIEFGYWDSLKKGLLSGEKLFYDLKRLETVYYEQNRREYELTKHISLEQLDPVALLKLRQNGECFVEIPEAVFDMDYPGHYFRRIKTVSFSMPCIAGSYTTIACTLTLSSNRVRKNAALLNNKYERDTTNDDPRFRDEIAAVQSIATSSARNDSGMFELNFRDERYLPFEGAGAISSWHIKLNKDFPQFDFSTISDVIIHINYTAREGGELLRAKATEAFNKKLNALALAESKQGLYRVFDLKREFSDKWYKFLNPGNTADDQTLKLDTLVQKLPFFTQKFSTKKVKRIEVLALMKNADNYKVMLSPLGGNDADLLALNPDAAYAGLHRASKDLAGSEIPLNSWELKIKKDGTADFKSLPADVLDDLYLVINYTVA